MSPPAGSEPPSAADVDETTNRPEASENPTEASEASNATERSAATERAATSSPELEAPPARPWYARWLGRWRGRWRARPARGRAHRRRRAIRLRRRALAWIALLTPALWIVGTDLLRRADRFEKFPEPKYDHYYWGSAAGSLVFWTVLVGSCSRPRRIIAYPAIALFLPLFVIVAGTQGAFFAMWNVYLCFDSQIHSKTLLGSVTGSLPLARPIVLFHFALALAIAVFSIYGVRRWPRPSKWRQLLRANLAVIAALGIFLAPASYRTWQAGTPDLLYFHGYYGLLLEHFELTHEAPDRRVQRRDPMPVPALTRAPSHPRNVLLILQESQRADCSCVEYDPNCDKSTPWTNALLPNRYPLTQMRANASTTAISISNIWSGVAPTERRDTLHSVPLVWEYAHAAGYDTAYWTSQNLIFGNARLYVEDIPASHFAVATHLNPFCDFDAGAIDALLSERVKEDWEDLEEPFFAVAHYSNVHYPYVYDEERTPFQPSEHDRSLEKHHAYVNYYRNVIYLSDLAVAELVRHVRSTDAGQRTVIVYTSDHGEAFREHWQMGHTSALYDEEVLVPTWIDAPPGTVSDEEDAALRGAKNELVWHLDMAPTFLDLLGVWDDPALAPFRARMPGHPITRPERTLGPLPMTNCTWVWECAFRNWGMMQGPLKLSAREWDDTYHCFHVLDDPEEKHDLGERACGPLPALARELFHVMPNVTPPGRRVVDW